MKILLLNNIVRYRNSVVLYSANSISSFGSLMFNYMVSWWLVNLTGDTILLSKITAITFLPIIIFNFISGFLVDFLNSKIVLIIANILNGILCLISFTILKDRFSFIILGILLIGIKVTSSCITLASKSILPTLFSSEEIVNINSTQSLLKEVLSVITPMIAGVLITIISPEIFILLNGVSYIMCGLVQIFLKPISNLKSNKKNTSLVPQFKDTFLYMLSKIEIIKCVILASIINFFLAAINLFPPYASAVFSENNQLFSIILTLQGLGALLAPVVIKLLTKYNKWLSYYNIIILLGISMILVSHISLPLLYFFYGMSITIFNIKFFSFIQVNVEQNYIGKVLGLILTFSIIFAPIGTVFFGYIIPILKVNTLVLVGMFLVFTSIVIKRYIGKNSVEAKDCYINH